METCLENDVTSCSAGKIPRRISPISREIDRAGGGQSRLVIVLGEVVNTMGVSMLRVSPLAGATDEAGVS